MIGTEILEMRSRGDGGESGVGHVPVLGDEVVRLFGAGPASGWILDGTVGLGGHSARILEAFPEIRVLGIDQDPDALELSRARLAGFGERVLLRRGRISRLAELARAEGIAEVAGVLLDLGVSSMQLDRAERGFSFQADGPLDMRMDPSRDRTAADIVNRWDESDLADLFYYEGGETRARQIARALVEGRRRAPFLRTGALAEAISSALGPVLRAAKIHPATKVFQALRRAVNEEGEELIGGLAAAERLVVPGGVLVAVGFHSGEDREVKRFLAEGAREGRWEVLTKKPVEASERERRENPRARSAKLRGARRASPEGRRP